MQLLSAIVGFLATRAHAADDIWGTENAGVRAMWQRIRGTVYDQSDLGGGNLVDSLSSAIRNFVFPMVGGAAVILIIYAGLKLVTGRGKDETLSEAKTITMYALLGVVLAVLATVVIGYVGTFLQTMLDGN